MDDTRKSLIEVEAVSSGITCPNLLIIILDCSPCWTSMSTSRFSKFSTGRSVRLQPLVDMDKVRLKQTKESTRIQELSNVHEHLVTLTMYKVVRQN